MNLLISKAGFDTLPIHIRTEDKDLVDRMISTMYHKSLKKLSKLHKVLLLYGGPRELIM